MAYQILRTKKLKTPGNVGGSLQHMLRANGKAPNADPGRTHLNDNSVNSVNEAMQKYEALEPEFKQANNVQALEFLITASPDFFVNEPKARWRAYLEDGLAWVKKMIGAENIVASSLQLDETSPHMSIIARPIVKRKFKGGKEKTALAAKRYVDGSEKLSRMQDNFFEEVASKYELERGQKGSKVKHTEIQTWYGEASGGAARLLEIERENERLKKQIAQERADFFERFEALENEINDLRDEGGRWRKKAEDIATAWFATDIKNAKTNEALDALRVEIQNSETLPRSAKQALNRAIDEQIKPDPTPTKKRSR